MSKVHFAVLAALLLLAPSLEAAEAQVDRRATLPAKSKQRPVKPPLRAALDGNQAVPAVLTPGTGEFRASIENPQLIRYELRYTGLIGGPVLFVSLHLGQPGVNGGFVAVLCGINEPACPTSGLLQGSLDALDIRGPAAQGVSPGDMTTAIKALQTGNAYIVIHTNRFLPPGGEIRGQIRVGGP